MTSSNERELIKAVIQVYFDSMYESDPSKVHEVFHPNAKITGYMGGRLAEMSVQEFADFVAAQPPGPYLGCWPILRLWTLRLLVTLRWLRCVMTIWAVVFLIRYPF